MDTNLQQKLADNIYYGVGQTMQAQRNAVRWFRDIPTTQKFIIVGLLAAIVLAIVYSFYMRARVAAQLSFDTAPSFLTNINKLHNTKRPYEYQYANGQRIPYLPARLFPTYNNFQFTWNFWIYVNGFDPKGKPNNDWGSYRFGEWKHVLSHGSSDILQNPNDLERQQYPGFWLKPKENTLSCVISTVAPEPNQHVHVDLVDLPLNEWLQITLVLNEMSLGLYKNGELMVTRMLPAAPMFIPNQNVYITNKGGFAGNLFSLQYFNEVLEPNRVRLLYKEGKKVVDDYIHSLNYDEFVKREFRVTNLSKDPSVHTDASVTTSTSSRDKELNTYKEKAKGWL